VTTGLPTPRSAAGHHAELAAVRAGQLGRVHSWELVTGVDGPGTRLTVFLSGCLLRCQYCHNPDTWAEHDGMPTTLEELVGRVRRYAPALRAAHGGVTLSGGEPLMQPAFTANVFRAAKELGLHTALDTSGFLGRHATEALLDDTDLVLLDVKSGLAGTYREVTGRELAPTLEFGRRLGERGTAIWVRFVLVPGLTDAPENVEAVADAVVSFGTVQRVEVLPFHQMGRDKWTQLGLPYPLADARPPTAEEAETVRARFRAHGLTVF